MDGSGNTIFNLFVIAFLLFSNGFFVASEFAMVKVRKTRIEQLVNEGNFNAKIALEALKDLDKFIAAVQLGVTISSIGLGWVGEGTLAHIIEPVFAFLPGISRNIATHTMSVSIAFALITFFHVVLGELIPKSIALEYTEKTALWVARPMQVLTFIFNPFIWLLNGFGNFVLKLLNIPHSHKGSLVHSTEELDMLVNASYNGGVLNETEKEMLHNVFKFSDLTAKQVMIPRTDMVCIPSDMPIEELNELAADSQYTSDEVAINKQDYLKYQKQTSCILGSDNSTIAAQLSVVYPKIYHNKISLNSAESLYQTIADTCQLKAMEKYSDIDMSENHIENPVNISYTSTYSVCEAAQDTVLSFSDKYVESAESFIAKGFTRKRITQVYGYNFDVENDKILTYEDIFENYDEAMNYISERVMNAGASEIEYLDDQTNTYTHYNMKKIISDNNWYIKDYEMVITVNGRQTQKAGGSSEYEVESPVQVSIDLDEFREKGIKFNNAYFNIH